MKKRIFAAACAGLCWVAVHAQDSLPYQNPSLSPSERAEDLLHRLTLKEKVSLMKNGRYQEYDCDRKKCSQIEYRLMTGGTKHCTVWGVRDWQPYSRKP